MDWYCLDSHTSCPLVCFVFDTLQVGMKSASIRTMVGRSYSVECWYNSVSVILCTVACCVGIRMCLLLGV